MVDQAVAFARRAHEGAFRKGSKIPYINHPLEAAVIVSLITDDEELVCAALLHDVVEDAGVTREELEERFGARVADLVMAESEDKSLSWTERKAATLRHLSAAGRDIQIVTLGDKLSNMRSTARDYLAMGDKVWERFNEKDKSKHAWYYLGVAECLIQLEPYPAYQEFKSLCRLVFGDGKSV